MRISIVTPTLNAADFLPECIDSIRNQNAAGIESEHIVADGGSTDATVEIAKAAGCVVIGGEDRGVFDAINKGTRAATGDAIGFIGSDDVLLDGALQSIARWFSKRKVDWGVGTMQWTGQSRRFLGKIKPPPYWMTTEIFASLGWSCFPHQATYITPRFFETVGGFNPDFHYAGDYDFFARALAVSTFDRIKGTLATFHRHGDNVSMTISPRHTEESEFVANTYGPRTRTKLFFYRQVLRIWLNLRSPSWFILKKIPDIRSWQPKNEPNLRDR